MRAMHSRYGPCTTSIYELLSEIRGQGQDEDGKFKVVLGTPFNLWECKVDFKYIMHLDQNPNFDLRLYGTILID